MVPGTEDQVLFFRFSEDEEAKPNLSKGTRLELRYREMRQGILVE